jgi:glycosyltransferase involved in cell wall biosynthesis
MARISLLLPTRGRPHLVQRLFDSLALHTDRLKHLEVILYLDEDDQTGERINESRFSITKIVGQQLTMGAYNTACLDRASGDIIMLLNDDVIVRTSAWDLKMMEISRRFSDGVFLAYPNDLNIGRRMCTFPICTKKVCELLIRPYPDDYKSYFIDWHLLDVFKRLRAAGYSRIFYLDDVVFEHCHYMAGKAELDATYAAKNYYEDDWTFLRLRPLRQRQAERLLAAIDGTTLPLLPAFVPAASRPDKTWNVLLRYISEFLLDPVLPIRERLQMFIWLTARYLRQQRYLPAKKPVHTTIHELRSL